MFHAPDGLVADGVVGSDVVVVSTAFAISVVVISCVVSSSLASSSVVVALTVVVSSGLVVVSKFAIYNFKFNEYIIIRPVVKNSKKHKSSTLSRHYRAVYYVHCAVYGYSKSSVRLFVRPSVCDVDVDCIASSEE